MKRAILLLFIITSFNSFVFSQDNPIRIPRTKVSMVIPEGYSIMSTITGLQKDKDHIITINEVTGSDFYTSTKYFNESAVEQQGLTVYEYKETKVDGYSAKYIISNTEDIHLNAITLVFGDETFSTMINSTHKAHDMELERYLTGILLAVKYDKELAVDPLEEVVFTVDTLSTDFKFYRFAIDKYIFTPLGGNNIASQSLVMIVPGPYDKTLTIEQVSETAINQIKQQGIQELTTDQSKSEIDGVEVLLTEGDAHAGPEHIYYHQVILVKDDLVLIIHGICNHNDDAMKADIKRFCESIKIKS